MRALSAHLLSAAAIVSSRDMNLIHHSSVIGNNSICRRVRRLDEDIAFRGFAYSVDCSCCRHDCVIQCIIIKGE